MRLVVFALASLVLMALDHRQHHLEKIRAGLSAVVYPLQLLVDMPSSIAGWVSENFASRNRLLEENSALRAESLLLKAQLQRLDSLQSENEHLRNLLQSARKLTGDVLIAEILAVDMAPFSRQIVINKGSRQGVYRGQPLLDAEGVMGQVVDVGPFSSTAMLITDPSHAVPVVVNRNNLRALVIGTGDPYQLDIPYLPNNADIRVGDLLITSGLGGRFPPGYPVARVTKIEIEPGRSYAIVTAEPSAQLERSREALLVFRSPQPDSLAESGAPTPPHN